MGMPIRFCMSSESSRVVVVISFPNPPVVVQIGAKEEASEFIKDWVSADDSAPFFFPPRRLNRRLFFRFLHRICSCCVDGLNRRKKNEAFELV